MARPKAEQTRSVSLRLRMFPEQEQLIRRAAGLAGISISAWIRERLIRAARKETSQMAQPKFPIDSFVRFRGFILRVGGWRWEDDGTISYSLFGEVQFPRVREAELRAAPAPPEKKLSAG